MLAQVLRRRPKMHGTLVDLPRTVARSVETFATSGVAERVTTVGQSFFDPLPAGADLYLLKGIINDWPDREAATILGRCAAAAAARWVRGDTRRNSARRRASRNIDRDGAARR